MRIPFPSNFTYADRGRVVLPPGLAAIWHGDAVEVDDATPAAYVEALRAALLAYDRSVLLPEERRLVDDKAAWLSRNWANKTPAEIQALVEGRIAGITTLAQAKAVLAELLPIMAWALSALAHQTLERD